MLSVQAEGVGDAFVESWGSSSCRRGSAFLAVSWGVTACGSGTKSSAPPGTSGSSSTASAGDTTSAAPVVIGSVGGYSGSAAITQLPGLQGLQAWVKTVDAAGGINGHQVKLDVADLGTFDFTKAAADVQRLAEQNHVVAFAGNFGAQGAGAAYLQQHNIPFIGGEDGAPQWWTNPMYFPFGGNGDTIGWGYVAAEQKFTSNRKLGTLVCTEIAGCDLLAKGAATAAKTLGFTVVYQGKAPVAAPNYAAQCLAAKGAGVDALLLGFDTGTDQTIGADCAQQGYNPSYLIASGDNTFVGKAEFKGSVTVAPDFPAVYNGPEVTAFHQAMQTYFPGVKVADYTAMGWAIGKALEKVLSAISGTITSQAILNGLWQFKAETLGGLTVPLTFVQGQPAPVAQCSYPELYAANGVLTAPDGLTPLCKP